MNFIRNNESTNFPNIAFIIRLAIDDEIPFNSLGMDLYFGDYAVRKYNRCKGGIFFKVYNPRFLTKHSGKEIYYQIEGHEKKRAGIKFPVIANQEAISDLISSTKEIVSAKQLLS